MNYDEWKSWWTDRAESYFTKKIWEFSQPALIDRLGIGKNSKVLEIGFGYGRELSQFCELSNHVYGLELSSWSCENTLLELKDRGVTVLPALATYNGTDLPFDSGTFDAIYSCYVVQHLSRSHAKKLIKECLRTLAPGGKVLFEFFGDLDYRKDGKKDDFSGIDGQGGMFNNGYSKEEIPKIISRCGGQVLWIEPQQITETWANQWVCFGGKNEK